MNVNVLDGKFRWVIFNLLYRKIYQVHLKECYQVPGGIASVSVSTF